MKEIANIEIKGQEVIVRQNDDGAYDILFDGVVKQPNHDIDGIIRALAHYLHNISYQNEKLEKELDRLKFASQLF